MTNDASDGREVELILDGSNTPLATQILAAFNDDPDWHDPRGLVWTAFLDCRTCPSCLVRDGQRCMPGQPGPGFDGVNMLKEHQECRCMLLPWKWRNEDMVSPDGRVIMRSRPAEGDRGKEEIPFSVTAEEWLRANPQTAVKIFGREIASSFLGLGANGRPVPPIPLKWAEKRWRDELEKALEPMRLYEERLARAQELYRGRGEPEQLRMATEAFESCLPLIYSAREAYRQYDIARGRDDDEYAGAWGHAYQQLAIIYEKQKRLNEALAVCQQALDAGWGGDWLPRMARLQKRMSKSQQS